MTLLIGPRGGFCDLTKGNTRVVIFGFIRPSLINKTKLLSKVCFSFKFFYENLIKKGYFSYQKKKKNFLFFNQLIFPLSSIFKKHYLDKKSLISIGFKSKLEFKIGVIENDGNLQDTISFGIGINVKSIEFPFIELYGQSGILNWKLFEIKFRNKKEFFVVSNSFSIQETSDGNCLFLFDPTYNEEFYSVSFLSIFMIEEGKIKNIIYGYEKGITDENLLIIFKISIRNFSFFGKLLKKILNQKNLKSCNKETIIIT